MDLLMKGIRWIWGEECQHAFEALKKTITKESVLALLDLNKPFVLHTNG